MSKSETSPQTSNGPSGPGRGKFIATPLEFELDGETYTYAGRGRWSVQLAKVVIATGKAPVKTDEVWDWRKATSDETDSATKLISNIAEKLKKKADKAALKLANKIAKKGTTPTKAKDKKVLEQEVT